MFRRHLWILTGRVLLLAVALYLFFFDKDKLDFTVMRYGNFSAWFLHIIWLVLMGGMLFRLFPNRYIAMGARKHYACSYMGTASATTQKGLHKGALYSAIAFIAINTVFCFALSLFNLLTPAAIMVLALFYAVCDIAFILFFCPFQKLFLHNHCCTVCRIYNWDYLMICLPLVLFPFTFYAVSLLLFSAMVVLRWEGAIRKNPHYFVVETNEGLSCAQCEERLCLLQKGQI